MALVRIAARVPVEADSVSLEVLLALMVARPENAEARALERVVQVRLDRNVCVRREREREKRVEKKGVAGDVRGKVGGGDGRGRGRGIGHHRLDGLGSFQQSCALPTIRAIPALRSHVFVRRLRQEREQK
jgi:hypothetical protein